MNKGETINVLDHGFVRLIDWMGNDERICEAARISYKAPSKGIEGDRKLIQYLYKNRHTSPFEMVKITLNIKLPLFVMRQYVRHRMQNLNEVSARYTELPNEFYIPSSWRVQDTKNKQGSLVTGGMDNQGNLIDDKWNPIVEHYNHIPTIEENYSRIDVTATEALIKHCHYSYELYQSMLAQGIAREMARMVLPVNIYTEIYACWDLKNLLHFITLREDSHAQAEIQEYGKAIKLICQDKFPLVMEAYEKYKWVVFES